jgi:dynein heavy chain
MKKVVEQKQVVVAQAKTECEELLVRIVQDKRVADEQEKQVGIHEALKAAASRSTSMLSLSSPKQPRDQQLLPSLAILGTTTSVICHHLG